MTIRPATKSDAPIICQFISDLEEIRLDSTRFADVFGRNLGNPLIHYVVAEVDTIVVGFVSCHVHYVLHHVGKVGEIQELYVRPAYRGNRIGQQLLDYLTNLARRENFVNLEVTTNQKRTDALRFYSREGFAATHHKLVKPISQP